MKRINTSYFYRLALQLTPLRGLSVNDKIYFECFSRLYNAQQELRPFLHNDLIPPMTSYSMGKTLLDLIEKITGEEFNSERVLQWFEAKQIEEALNHFEIALQSDFGSRDTFIVSPKSTHSTTLLSERGETMVSDFVRELVPDVSIDLHEAGRCVAFELPTAAAFHLFRAVEAVVKSYGEFVLGRPFSDRETKGGLGAFSNCLKNRSLSDKVDERITTAIDNIASLHRNPTMHPKWHISNTEVLATIGLAVGIMETIALDWSRRKNDPSTPLSEIIPDDTKVLALSEDSSVQRKSRSRRRKKASDES